MRFMLLLRLFTVGFAKSQTRLSILLFIHSFSIFIYSLFLLSAPFHKVGDISLGSHCKGTSDLKSGDFFFSSQPKITQQGHIPISNQGCFFLFLFLFFFSLSLSLSKGTPNLKSGDFFSLNPRSHIKGCPQSPIRGFFLSAQDHTARTAPDLQSGDFFSQPKFTQQGLPPISNQGIFFFSAQVHTARTAPNLQSGDFFSQPKITQQGLPPTSNQGIFFFSQPKFTQQGLPPISNQGIFLSAQDHTARTAPDLQSGDLFSQPKFTQQGLPLISNQGIFSLSPSSHSKDCPRSPIRGFFLSAQVHTARTAPDLQSGDFFSQPKFTQQGLPLISNQGIFSLSPRSHSKDCPQSQIRGFFF